MSMARSLLAVACCLAQAALVQGTWVLDRIPLDAVDPPITDLWKFPIYEASEQSSRCQEHLLRLRRLRGIRGHEHGAWDAAVAQTELAVEYWQTLEAVKDAWFEPVQQRLLARLKALIGPAKYLRRWSPALCPEPEKFWDHIPTPRPLILFGVNGS